ncbi:MAG: YvcK family protein [Deltaproteobacteria bacterium]|nr:MAG: YvcK family protein [Deltaproteobacteria bacterium]
MSSTKAIEDCLTFLGSLIQSPLDLLPHQDFAEKLIYLELQGPPDGLPNKVTAALDDLASSLSQFDVKNTKVVVLGGGTGLSNIIGGDSRLQSWPEEPFRGLKDIFPQTKAIVCVTDDGGSTGELLKDLPLIALGDLRHVLLSSIRKKSLQDKYGLDETQCLQVSRVLHELFNYRFDSHPGSMEKISAETGFDAALLPGPMHDYLAGLLEMLFTDPGLEKLLSRPHCLGNLLLAAAIWQEADESIHKDHKTESCHMPYTNAYQGLKQLCRAMALAEDAVMPCSITPAGLQVLYSNGTLVSGEYKSSHARRGYPVDRLFVSFVEEPKLPDGLLNTLKTADVIILAPGSLYTSTIPIFQVPGLAEAVCSNEKALKILVSNLWVQKGETDVVREDPKRRFYVSDLIKAYHRNIPGGVRGLFSHVLSLGLQDISGSILQNYAMEDKVPIFLDREKIGALGFKSIEAGIFSQAALRERNVIQHDPGMLARATRTLVASMSLQLQNQDSSKEISENLPGSFSMKQALVQKDNLYPCKRYTALQKWLDEVSIRQETGSEDISGRLLNILWFHQDILLGHMSNIKAIEVIDRATWSRSQEWDNVYSFYDPVDSTIKICQDVVTEKKRLEQAFLVALGQALLGNYAAAKEMEAVKQDGEAVGKMFRLTVRQPADRNTFFSDQELSQYLKLARMKRSESNTLLYTRLVNGNEGFTPPGLLFGLIYAWYLDNRLAEHVEYKMAVMRTDISDLIPEQVRVHARRRALVEFFRRSVFCHSSQMYDEIPV